MNSGGSWNGSAADGAVPKPGPAVDETSLKLSIAARATGPFSSMSGDSERRKFLPSLGNGSRVVVSGCGSLVVGTRAASASRLPAGLSEVASSVSSVSTMLPRLVGLSTCLEGGEGEAAINELIDWKPSA